MPEGTPKPPPLPQAKPSPATAPVAGVPAAAPSAPRGQAAGSKVVGSKVVAGQVVAGPVPGGPVVGFPVPGGQVAAGKTSATKPPIRPVGFRDRELATNLVYAATIIQMLVAGLTAAYFYDLRRFSWTTEVTAGDAALDLTGDFIESTFPVDNLPLDDQDRFMEYLVKRVQFVRLIIWMFYGNLAIGFAEAFCFAFWQYRMRRNVAALGSVGLRHSPVLGVVWWFVPVAVLFMPVLVVQEIWRASDPTVPPGDGRAWRIKRSSFLVGSWWSVLLLTKLLYWFTAFMLVFNLITIFSPITLQAMALSGTVAAGILQIQWVRRLVRRQASLCRLRMRAVEKAEAAGEPTVPAVAAPT